MPNTGKYQLYISNECNCCDKILARLGTENIAISVINIDQHEYNLPFKLSILPALVKENKIVCYGSDDIYSKLKIA